MTGKQADEERAAGVLARDAAMVEVVKASLTLGEAEGVFMQAAGTVADAVRRAAMTGLPLGVIKRQALANDGLHALARGHVLLAIEDEERRAELAATAEVEGGRARQGGQQDRD